MVGAEQDARAIGCLQGEAEVIGCVPRRMQRAEAGDGVTVV